MSPPLTPDQAADLAASALLDTLDAVRTAAHQVDGLAVVALDGDARCGARAADVLTALCQCVVLPQRGACFADRLAAAHIDVATAWPASHVVQIGMDTPQIGAAALTAAAQAVNGGGEDCVIGPAEDGGWWLLALRRPTDAAVLADVPMSSPHTLHRTDAALASEGVNATRMHTLTDVDTWEDAQRVAEEHPELRFAQAVERSSAGSR